MRKINKIAVVCGYGKSPDDIVAFSNERGFEYPMAHFFIGVAPDGEVIPIKMRPVGKRCAVMKDAMIADTAIGFVVGVDGPEIPKGVSVVISQISKSIADDLDIKIGSIVSDEIEKGKRVDISDVSLANIPSMFKKLR